MKVIRKTGDAKPKNSSLITHHSSLAARRRRAAGYALLDVIVALTVFSIWGVSLMGLLREISLQSQSNARDRLVQYQVQSLITEARHKPVEEVTGDYLDENLNVRFTTTIEPLQLANVDGNGLNDLYTLKVIAQWEERGETITETAEIFLYKPQEDR